MKSAFSINKEDRTLDVLITDSIPGTYVIQFEGKLDDAGLNILSEALDRLLKYDIDNVIFDFSKITLVASAGWNYLLKLKSLLSGKKSDLLFMRMPPTVYGQFVSFELSGEFAHYRAFGEIIKILKEKEQHADKASINSYEGLHAGEDISIADDNGENSEEVFPHEEVEEYISDENTGDFPLHKSRKVFTGEKDARHEEAGFQGPDVFANAPSGNENEIPERLIAIRGKLRSLFEMKIYEWKSQGFDTSYLDGFLDRTLDETKQGFSLFSERMAECLRYKEIMASTDTSGMESLTLDFTQKLYDPMKIDDIRTGFKVLMDLLKKTRSNALNPLFEYQFANFIKGEGNKESYDMAFFLSDNLNGQERPVFIVGPNGTGKTHILNAIGNKVREEYDKKIHYVTSLDFIREFESYRGKEKLDFFREKFTSCDMLLFDDLHHLDCNPDAAVEFRYLYDKALQDGAHMFIASVFTPDEFTSLSKDLVSRLNNSVFLTLRDPDIQTLMEIVRSRFNILEIQFRKDVPEIIAELSHGNIRKALGYINTLSLYHETYGEIITPDIVSSLIVPDNGLKRFSRIERQTEEQHTDEPPVIPGNAPETASIPDASTVYSQEEQEIEEPVQEEPAAQTASIPDDSTVYSEEEEKIEVSVQELPIVSQDSEKYSESHHIHESQGKEADDDFDFDDDDDFDFDDDDDDDEWADNEEDDPFTL